MEYIHRDVYMYFSNQNNPLMCFIITNTLSIVNLALKHEVLKNWVYGNVVFMQQQSTC